jgi:hypothetical protein
MTSFLLALAAILVVSPSAHAAPKLSAADKAWIEKCTSRLVTESLKKPRASRIYCTCMHEMVENNEEMSQSDLEHSWPPMHLSCRKEAGWHRERNP